MQTFLPYADFSRSAFVLDDRRLGKQRVEALQILNALHGLSRGWVNHPATRMWQGYEEALEQYLRFCILEWTNRGFRNNMAVPAPRVVTPPPWLGDDRVHASHRSNLLRKSPLHYGRWLWTDPPDLPYHWPVA